MKLSELWDWATPEQRLQLEWTHHTLSLTLLSVLDRETFCTAMQAGADTSLAARQAAMRLHHQPAPADGAGLPRLWSPQQLSVSWGVSVDTVRRQFEREPGVLVIGSERYRTLRIPQEVVERVHRKREVVC